MFGLVSAAPRRKDKVQKTGNYSDYVEFLEEGGGQGVPPDPSGVHNLQIIHTHVPPENTERRAEGTLNISKRQNHFNGTSYYKNIL